MYEYYSKWKITGVLLWAVSFIPALVNCINWRIQETTRGPFHVLPLKILSFNKDIGSVKRGAMPCLTLPISWLWLIWSGQGGHDPIALIIINMPLLVSLIARNKDLKMSPWVHGITYSTTGDKYTYSIVFWKDDVNSFGNVIYFWICIPTILQIKLPNLNYTTIEISVSKLYYK